MYDAIESALDFICDRPLVLFGLLVSPVVVLCIAIAISEESSKRECETKGWRWGKTGEATIYVTHGNITVPQTYDVSGCIGPAEREP